jgi:hypothetical protein
MRPLEGGKEDTLVLDDRKRVYENDLFKRHISSSLEI